MQWSARWSCAFVLFSCCAPAWGDEAQPAAAPSAQALRQAVHDARSVWRDFPGFTADIVVAEDAKSFAGKINVTSDFEYQLEIDDAAKAKWVDEKLNSVISHRRPGSVPDGEATFADDVTTHVNGRLVTETDHAGTFRIDGSALNEVHRKSDKFWFEISNIENFQTDDGKFLPQTTSVVYRDPKTGDIESNRTNLFTWKKVGNFYLPDTSLTVDVGSGGARTVRKLSFTNHQLAVTGAAVSTDAILHKPLVEPLTSFGAAVLGDYLYVFSGHNESAHGFGRDLLSDHFRRIKFDDPKAEWEELAKNDPAQSTALVTDGKYLYRVGGLSFLNSGDDEKTVFKSTDHFHRYDPATNEWTSLAPLPQPRSSLDAAVLGRSVYVAGGWNLQGESSSDSPWHEDMLRFDLDKPEAGWQTLPGPGYTTRAASLAAHDGKIYLIGGIQQRGMTRKVSVYDPATNAWTAGPELKADSSAAGFATSSFATGARLYVTGDSGVVYRLKQDGSDWEIASRQMFPRMFLRLLPASENRLLAIGGTSLGGGRMSVIESIPVHQAEPSRAMRWSVEFGGRAKQSQILVLHRSKLYAFGGNASRAPHDFSKDAFVDEAFVFDVPGRRVEKLPNLPQAMQSGAAVAFAQTSEHQAIIVAGGLGMVDDEFGALSNVYAFDLEPKTWRTAAVKLPQPRAMYNATTYEDAIWLFGGSDAGHGSGLLSTVDHWWGDDSPISALPDVAIPTPRRSFGGAAVGSEYFMVGGLGEKTGLAKTVDVFNFDDRTWRTAAAPATPRVFPSLAATKDKLFLYGGFTQIDGHFAPATSLEVYDIKNNKWQTIAEELPGIEPSMSMINMQGRLLFYGIDKQVDGKANFVLYDPEPLADPGVVEAMNFAGRSRGQSEAAANAKSLMRKDVDKDGRLTIAELGERLNSLLAAGDADKDGQLTYAELKAALIAEEEASQTEPPARGQ